MANINNENQDFKFLDAITVVSAMLQMLDLEHTISHDIDNEKMMEKHYRRIMQTINSNFKTIYEKIDNLEKLIRKE